MTGHCANHANSGQHRRKNNHSLACLGRRLVFRIPKHKGDGLGKRRKGINDIQGLFHRGGVTEKLQFSCRTKCALAGFLCVVVDAITVHTLLVRPAVISSRGDVGDSHEAHVGLARISNSTGARWSLSKAGPTGPLCRNLEEIPVQGPARSMQSSLNSKELRVYIIIKWPRASE